MKNLSSAQKVGAPVLVLVGLLAVVQLIWSLADGLGEFLFDFDAVGAGWYGGWSFTFCSLAAAGALVAAAIALFTGSRGATLSAGVLGLGAVAFAVLREVSLAVNISDFGGSYADRFGSEQAFTWPYGWVWDFLVLVLVLVGAILIFIGPGRTAAATQPAAPTYAPQAPTSYAPQAPATYAPAATAPPAATSGFYLWVNGAEYGPYGADDIRAFVAEGRVVPESMIRPATGTWAPASSVPGLFTS